MTDIKKEALKNIVNDYLDTSTATSAKICMAQGLVLLMQDRELDKISISDIVKKAGVSRMSYYRYFTSKVEILESYMAYILNEYRHTIDEVYSFPFRSYEHILYSFHFLKNYKDFILCLDRANLTDILLYELNKYIEEQIGSVSATPSEYYSSYYYAGALCNIYVQWMKRDMKETPEKMADVVYKLSNW